MKLSNSNFFIIVIILIILLFIYFYKSNIQNNQIINDNNNEITNLCNIINNDNLNNELKEVYILKNIFSKEECDYIIKESEDYAVVNGWKTQRHEYSPTIDNDIKNIVNLTYLIENKIYSKIIPYYNKYYNIPENILGIDETFIVKYSIGGQTYLEPHKDADDFSFVVTLNNDFVGGGTYFLNTQKKVTSNIGDVVIFCGKNKHMGLEITEGTRYILAGFLSLNKNSYCDDMDPNIESEKGKISKETFINYLH